MNADQLKGKWMQFKGELKQRYSKFTDDDLTKIVTTSSLAKFRSGMAIQRVSF